MKLWAVGQDMNSSVDVNTDLYNVCYLRYELWKKLINILYKKDQWLTSSVGVNTEERGHMQVCLTHIYLLIQPLAPESIGQPNCWIKPNCW